MKIKAYRDKSYYFRFIFVARHLEQGLTTDLLRFKMTLTEALCLIAIFSETKNEILLSEMASILGFKKSLVSHAIANLEEQKYLKRGISEKDKRRFQITLTEAGKRTAPKLMRIFNVNDDGLENKLSASEMAMLDKIFEKIMRK